MFTLIRPIAAVLLGVFAIIAAQAYEPLFDPDARWGSFPLWAAGVSAVIGWVFLGGRIGRSIWFSAYFGVQAVVLAAIATAGFLAVGEVFSRGYQRRYTEMLEAATGYFEIVVDWLGRALVAEFLVLMIAGGLVLGAVLHVVWAMMERRRNAR